MHKERKPTLNGFGVQLPLFGATKQAISMAKNKDIQDVLELGCAFGNATKEMLPYANVTANDLDRRHLDVLESEVDLQPYNYKLSCVPGELQKLDFPDGSFDLILAANVFCFLSPTDFTIALGNVFKWLRPGGCFLCHNGTPFGKRAESFLNEYKKRRSNGDEFPGFITDTKVYMPSNKPEAAELPSCYHLLSEEVFLRETKKLSGAMVIASYLDNLCILPELPHLTSKGKEWLLIKVCKKTSF